jgi:hypothetical protein
VKARTQCPSRLQVLCRDLKKRAESP